VSKGARASKDRILLRLDPTVAKATLNAVTNDLWELSARRARLEVEREHAASGALARSRERSPMMRALSRD